MLLRSCLTLPVCASKSVLNYQSVLNYRAFIDLRTVVAYFVGFAGPGSPTLPGFWPRPPSAISRCGWRGGGNVRDGAIPDCSIRVI